MMLRDFKPVPGVWGKARPGWAQANEVLRMRIGDFFRSPRRPSHERKREGMKVNARPER
ncbi:MAG: hypothetical protein V6S10_01505 [Candidatus Methanoglobus sp.]